MKHGKKYQDSKKLIDAAKLYEPEEAVALVKQISKAKFDETIELSIRLGVDPRHADQQVRGTVVLPHGTGKKVKVLVFAKADKAKEAEAAGADYVGDADLVAKIQSENWFDFDACVAGVMPNPKSGTVTMDVTKAVHDIKAGKVEYRVDKTSICHCPIGKASFDNDKLVENLRVLMDAIIKAKPATAKGTYVRSLYMSTTMGPSIRLNSLKF